jgi:hypothetical protein
MVEPLTGWSGELGKQAGFAAFRGLWLAKQQKARKLNYCFF